MKGIERVEGVIEGKNEGKVNKKNKKILIKKVSNSGLLLRVVYSAGQSVYSTYERAFRE